MRRNPHPPVANSVASIKFKPNVTPYWDHFMIVALRRGLNVKLASPRCPQKINADETRCPLHLLYSTADSRERLLGDLKIVRNLRACSGLNKKCAHRF